LPRKPLTDRSLRAIKTRKKLFYNAAKLINAYGYDNVTIEEICKKAGVSVGAFYHYFNSKSDIMVELFKQIDYYYEETVAPEFSGDVAADIDTFFRYYAKFHVEQGHEPTGTILKTQGEFFLDKDRYMYVCLHRLVNAAIADGMFGDGTTEDLVVDYLLIVARGLLFDWVLARGKYDLAAKMDEYIALAKKSLR